MDIFINIFATTVFIAVVFFIVFLYKTVKIEDRKLNIEKADKVLEDVSNIAFRIVLGLTQTTVSKLKEEDKWNSEVSKTIFKQALQETKYQIGQEGLKFLKNKVTDVDSYLGSLIESLVLESKAPNNK